MLSKVSNLRVVLADQNTWSFYWDEVLVNDRKKLGMDLRYGQFLLILSTILSGEIAFSDKPYFQKRKLDFEMDLKQ